MVGFIFIKSYHNDMVKIYLFTWVSVSLAGFVILFISSSVHLNRTHKLLDQQQKILSAKKLLCIFRVYLRIKFSTSRYVLTKIDFIALYFFSFYLDVSYEMYSEYQSNAKNMHIDTNHLSMYIYVLAVFFLS